MRGFLDMFLVRHLWGPMAPPGGENEENGRDRIRR